MSIKTDELQTVNAPALTDTILLANSAGGTAQLSMAQAAAFFGAEMVKTGNPVGAALSSKAAKSVQETVEAVRVSTEEITLEASELPAFITGLPRLLTTYYIINVSGTLDEWLNIVKFYGGGGLRIVSDTPGGCVFQKPVAVSNCGVDVQFWNMTFRQTKALGGTDAMLTASASRYVRVTGSEFVGLGQESGRGAHADDSACLLLEGCKIHGFNQALFVGRCAKALVTGADVDFYDNTTGVYAWMGGEAFLNAPDLLGGSANLKQGGMIVKGDGTLL